MQPAEADRFWMQRAIRLAACGRGRVEPNPMVGCVIVRDGQCIGEGFHRQYGGPHAEVEAIRSLADRSQARGAAAYVSLEPCCHSGKTPPCTEALIDAGIGRVVAAMHDPFPAVDGGGLKRLADAGVATDVGVCEREARELCAPYLKLVTEGRPWVIAKWAMTLDGRIATVTGDSQWISGELSRAEVHRLRGIVDAIIVGGGTAAADDPTLTARPPGPRTAMRIVVADRRLPAANCRLIRTLGEAPVMIAAAPSTDERELQKLAATGVEIHRCDSAARTAMIDELLAELGRRRMTNVLVEGGGGLLGSFLAADRIDEAHVYLAPKLVGGSTAPGPVAGIGFDRLVDSPAWGMKSVTRLDDDVRIVIRRRRDT